MYHNIVSDKAFRAIHAWVQRKLGDIAEFSKGNGYSKGDLIDKGNPIILYGRLYTNYETLIENVDTFTKMKENSVLSQGGEVIIPSSGETAEDISRASVVAKAGIILGGDLNIVKPDSTIYPTFLAIIISNGNQQKELSKRAQGKSVVHISNSDLKEVVLQLPSITEQIAINNFFRTLDDTITLYKRKLDGLKELKRGYLQQMFPQSGEDIPLLRFVGFAEPWEQLILNDIVVKLTGGASIEPNDYQDFGVRTIPKGAINATGVADLSGSKFISNFFYEKNKSSMVSTTDIVTSLRDLVPSAPSMGRIVRIEGAKEDFLMPQGVYKIELLDGISENFVISYSNSEKYRKIIFAEKNGSTQVHIRNGEFLNIDIPVPSSDEQSTIGNFFRNLDDQIAAYQSKLDKLKQLKSTYLQKMFI